MAFSANATHYRTIPMRIWHLYGERSEMLTSSPDFLYGRTLGRAMKAEKPVFLLVQVPFRL